MVKNGKMKQNIIKIKWYILLFLLSTEDNRNMYMCIKLALYTVKSSTILPSTNMIVGMILKANKFE